ncbi:hypothetical protein BBJ28_00026926 [Nothophytophthora sp. Chile5]|nr:hypothetical protein BBJ28_00026926 [Nothophytophthora sp. Chile5]
MLTQHYIKQPDRRPRVWDCIKRLARGSIPYILAGLALMFGMSSFVARLSLTAGLSKFKLDFYLAIMCNHVTNTCITQTARRIYFQETCEGRERQSRRHQKRKSPVLGTGLVIKARPSPVSPSETPNYRPPSFWRAYLASSSIVLPVMLAGGYVHLVSQSRIVERGTAAIACFLAVSMLAKLVLQETAKHYVVKKRVRSIRIMCILVGVPTVLIDTQTRITLLGMQNTGIAAASTLGMAFLEIFVRVGKAAFVTWSIRRRQNTVKHAAKLLWQPRASQQQIDSATITPGTPVVAVQGPASRIASLAELQWGFELWRHQRQAYHTAELNADMYAEYIAIGCSASMLVFFGEHKHYMLLRLSRGTESGTEAAVRRVGQLHMLIFQVVVEMVVDYTSIVLEITAGIEFDRIKGLGSFLAALFMTTAVINIIISAIIYLN